MSVRFLRVFTKFEIFNTSSVSSGGVLFGEKHHTIFFFVMGNEEKPADVMKRCLFKNN